MMLTVKKQLAESPARARKKTFIKMVEFNLKFRLAR